MWIFASLQMIVSFNILFSCFLLLRIFASALVALKALPPSSVSCLQQQLYPGTPPSPRNLATVGLNAVEIRRMTFWNLTFITQHSLITSFFLVSFILILKTYAKTTEFSVYRPLTYLFTWNYLHKRQWSRYFFHSHLSKTVQKLTKEEVVSEIHQSVPKWFFILKVNCVFFFSYQWHSKEYQLLSN